jgi:hypothetical protein
MADTRVTYENVEVLQDDGSGFTCLIEGRRVFVGKYVPVDGTTVVRTGDRGRLVLPLDFAEAHRLPQASPRGGPAG